MWESGKGPTLEDYRNAKFSRTFIEDDYNLFFDELTEVAENGRGRVAAVLRALRAELQFRLKYVYFNGILLCPQFSLVPYKRGKGRSDSAHRNRMR